MTIGTQKSLDQKIETTATRELILLDAATTMEMWPELRYHIVYSMPMSNWSEECALYAVNRSLLHVWVYKEGGKVLAVLTTTFEGDAIVGTESLLLYTASSVSTLSDEDWATMYATLAEFAKQSGYDRIIAYTGVEHLIRVVNKLGGDTSITFCTLPVGE